MIGVGFSAEAMLLGDGFATSKGHPELVTLEKLNGGQNQNLAEVPSVALLLCLFSFFFFVQILIGQTLPFQALLLWRRGPKISNF